MLECVAYPTAIIRVSVYARADARRRIGRVRQECAARSDALTFGRNMWIDLCYPHLGLVRSYKPHH